MKTVPALFDLACDMVGRRKLRALSCSPPVLVTIEVRKSQVDRKMGLRYRQLSCAERIAQRTSKERQLTLKRGVLARIECFYPGGVYHECTRGASREVLPWMDERWHRTFNSSSRKMKIDVAGGLLPGGQEEW